MDFVNGVRAIIIDRSTEDASKNNSTILLLQSEERWVSTDIRRLKEQLTPNQQLIILPDSTNVVPIRMGEVVAQEKHMNNFELGRNCGNCMYQECDPLDRSSWPCYTCDSTNSGWKPKEEEKHE